MSKIDPSMFSWNRLGMTEKDWKALANAFYSLAHNDMKDFDALPTRLKLHPIGRICTRFIDTGNSKYIEEAGYALTHTREWYVFLGR